MKTFAQELHDFQHRAQTAETLHQELTARLPEATRPLLRQIESMQAAALAQQDAWATAERALQVSGLLAVEGSMLALQCHTKRMN